jgi:tRNA(fMet)-specific endonuclease VapC
MRASGKYLLDTSIVIDILRDVPEVVQESSKTTDLFISAITLGELYYGAYKSDRSSQNLEIIRQFKQTCTVLSTNDEVAECYGWLKNYLRRSGKPIPENDLWIAATALVYELPLVTHDSHFSRVPDLEIVEW